MPYVAHARRRERHPDYIKNRNRIKIMLTPTYGAAFAQENRLQSTETSAGKTVFLNPVDYDALDYKKWCLSLTNEDVLALMRNLSGGCDTITMPTLIRKLKGRVDFSAGEIVLLREIFNLSDDEVLDIFHLRSQRQSQIAAETD